MESLMKKQRDLKEVGVQIRPHYVYSMDSNKGQSNIWQYMNNVSAYEMFGCTFNQCFFSDRVVREMCNRVARLVITVTLD